MSKDKNNIIVGKSMREDDTMNAMAERYCPISESIIESCKEVKLMRDGKLPKKTWKELKEELKKIKENND